MLQEKVYSGKTISLCEDGYFADAGQWNLELAKEIAAEEGIELTDLHAAVIEFIRMRFFKGEIISIRSINHSGIIDVKTFYRIFPGAPLKKACRIAGLPKPTSCV
jgi:dissimilatory sulfite reductase related protein